MEIATLETVQQPWGLVSDVGPLEFASTVYGARFNFVSGSPGYVGDIYILQGDFANGSPAAGFAPRS